MSTKTREVKIALVDDHQLFRQGLANLVQQVDPSFQIVKDFGNGQELLNWYTDEGDLSLVILDIHMPVLNGHQTTIELRKKFTQIPILALSMMDDETTLVKMLKAGVNGYLNKDIEPEELKKAISSAITQGYYHSEYMAGKLVSVIQSPGGHNGMTEEINEQELRFIELACSEYTYKEVADIMCLSVKTIDGYRARLFEKLDVKSRVGLVLYALQNKLVTLDEAYNL
jgi:DNA-binding NarL/FixJ family response regulator